MAWYFILLVFLVIQDMRSAEATAPCSGSDPINRVHIVGLLEISPTSTCDANEDLSIFGLSLALAAEYIIDLVNGTNSALSVPGVQYDFVLENICRNRSFATRKAALSIPESVWTEQRVCLHETQNMTEQGSLLLGFIGPAYSSNAKYAAEFLNNTNIPLITPSATLAELSDKQKYNSLFRTAISDEKQSKAIVEVALKFEWSYVLLVHTDDEYGRKGAETVSSYAELKGICFSDTLEVKIESDDPLTYYDEISKQIKSDPARTVIFFGAETVAITLMENLLDLIRSADDKKLILSSEGVGKSPKLLEVLSSSNGELEFFTLAPYNEQTPLESYIQERIDNRSGAKKTDALIEEFLQRCSESQGCSQDSLLKASDGTQQTIDSIVSLLYAFKETQNRLCQGGPGLCSDLGNSPLFYSAMMNTLLTASIQANISDLDIAFSYDLNGDIDNQKRFPAFTLNLATDSEQAWTYQPIGLYHHNDSWTYDDGQMIAEYSSRCISDCYSCLKEAAPYIYRRNENSRYIIAGTAAVTDIMDELQCGQEVTPNGFIMMESFYYAVQQIHDITGMEFSTLFIDTCYATLGTQAIMSSIFRETDTAYLTDTNNKEWAIKPTDFVVFIGDASSGVSLVLQTYLSLFNIPQISYRSTSIWLSDSFRYPMFLRTVPSDEEQARLMVDILQQNDWSNIGLIQSNTVYGQTGGNLVLKYASKAEICVSYHKIINGSQESINELADSTRITAMKSELPRVIVIFAEERLIADFLRRIQLTDPQWNERGNILIGSESWNKLTNVIEGVEKFVYGSLTFAFSDDTYSWTVNGNNHFKNYLATQRPDNNLDNRPFIHFWQQYFDCYLPQNSLPSKVTRCEEDYSLDKKGAELTQLDYEDVVGKQVVIAGLSVAYSLREAVFGENQCIINDKHIDCSPLFDTTDGRLNFFRYLQNTKVPEQVGSSIKSYLPYLPSGDGKVNYKVYNIIKAQDSALYNHVYSVNDGVIVEKDQPQFYLGGKLDVSPVSECTTSCQCFNDFNSSIEVATTTPTTTWKAPAWLLPLLLVIALLVAVLIAIVVYIILLSRKSTKEKGNYEYLTMHQLTREGTSTSIAPVPPLLPQSALPRVSQPQITRGVSQSEIPVTGLPTQDSSHRYSNLITGDNYETPNL
ncbi:uncharacterized protein [Watersipora subatra]|uniref:uncharacterized protein isoform X2 n=1 Tax=Watersipora subatra TaxID=2589382 RepID=UPI00355C4596